MKTELIKYIVENAIEELIISGRYIEFFESEWVDDLSLCYIAILFREMGWVVEYNKTSTGVFWSFDITRDGYENEKANFFG